MSAAEVQWAVAIAVVVGCAALGVLAAARERPVLAVPSLLPAAAGAVVRFGGVEVTEPARPWVVVLAFATVTLGVVAGGPLSMWVLHVADGARRRSGGPGHDREILRGGATIGYLERIGTLAAVGAGRVEILVAVIAIKGLGRFTELSTSDARERFIIGTLVSLTWAGLCGALVWPGRL